MATYSFVTTFTLSCDIKTIWKVLLEYPRWPSWWKGIREMHMDESITPPSLDVRLGFSFYNLKIKMTPLKIDPGKELTLLAEGDLKGTGRFTFEQTENHTTVTFYWDVMTTKLWMNMLAPIAKPFFTFSHNLVMKWFVNGLAKETHSTVLSATYK